MIPKWMILASMLTYAVFAAGCYQSTENNAAMRMPVEARRDSGKSFTPAATETIVIPR